MIPGARRRSYEAGHRPKFLAIVDETPECDRAVRYAARRGARIGVGIVLLGIVPPLDAPQILGVAEMMKAEAEAEVSSLLARFAQRAREISGIEAEGVVRSGDRARAITDLIASDEDIAVLVLAASTGKEGPGPLIEQIVGKGAGSFPIPIAIVPGHLTDEEIDSLA